MKIIKFQLPHSSRASPEQQPAKLTTSDGNVATITKEKVTRGFLNQPFIPRRQAPDTKERARVSRVFKCPTLLGILPKFSNFSDFLQIAVFSKFRARTGVHEVSKLEPLLRSSLDCRFSSVYLVFVVASRRAEDSNCEWFPQ